MWLLMRPLIRTVYEYPVWVLLLIEYFSFLEGLVRMRFIESDENLTLRGSALEEAIKDDIKLGLIPFWVSVSYKILITSLSIEPVSF